MDCKQKASSKNVLKLAGQVYFLEFKFNQVGLVVGCPYQAMFCKIW